MISLRPSTTLFSPQVSVRAGAGDASAPAFDHVLDAVLDGVILSEASGVRLNAAARRLLGVTTEPSIRTADLNPRRLDGTPFDLDPEGAPGHTTLEQGSEGRFRIRITSYDRRELVIDGSVTPVVEGAVIVFRDVTDEHEESELNRQTLRAVFDTIPTAISILDPETREVLGANRALCELLERPEGEIVGKRPPYPWWDEDVEPAALPEPRTTFERVFRRQDGRPQPVQIALHTIEGSGGRPALLLALITDLDEERRLKQQLVQSGKLAAIGELAAGVAHEINNPLFAILGLTEFLLAEADPGTKNRQRLELIQETGLEIKEIVRALLDFARENADERHVVPLEEVVRSTVDLVRRTNAHKGVELVDRYDGSDALVSASPNQLKQIFLNLVANARQAMPHGGTVTVEVRREGDVAVATVADDGPGIDPDVLERIFEPFFTTKRDTGGTGLGLSVSLGIAESHGGSLTVASEPGHGTTFCLRLPVAVDDGDANRSEVAS